ncbi:hypothetical protein CLU96_1273 [Chryseobacterium sp. 52]|uniref:hypothetical protein n=1 Tax=Chryseobacterium sp. 52 TaxID=2035213 RepID=UPI000C19C59B|nr:hypothetical protein [Chryseobacterium sp. 52]PIF44329.1 hypothetical protein CLU96_1273 [Chryseobacterium sp. 52]
MDQKINLNVQGLSGEPTTLFIGQANTPKEPTRLVVAGDFSAVGNFLKVKLKQANGFQEIKPENAIVICDYDNLSIKLETNPNDEYGTVISGKAEYSNELKEFGINQSKFFRREELIKILRYNRRFFPNKEENAKLLSSYQNFTASVKKDISDNSDTRGNIGKTFNKQIKTDIAESFVIEIPIFKGESAVSFPVEICLEDNDSGVRFWFESVELAELLEIKRNELFQRELEYCEGLAVIYK